MSRFFLRVKKLVAWVLLRIAPSIEPSLKTRDWVRAGCPMPAPWNIKMQVLERYMIPGASWIETGTYRGETTAFLAEKAPRVVSLEPELALFLDASKRLSSSKNIKILNKTNGEGLLEALDVIQSSKICFWLDGHYSGGPSFAGVSDTPILQEISLIADKLRDGSITEVSVFIDDVRLFASRHKEGNGAQNRPGYPPLGVIVSWAEEMNLGWHIEHDIFVARSGHRS